MLLTGGEPAALSFWQQQHLFTHSQCLSALDKKPLLIVITGMWR